METKQTRLSVPLKAMLSGVRSEWYAAYRLARRAFTDRYKNSRFGLLWEFLDPLVLALIFILLHQYRGITFRPTGIPYSVFVVTGLLLWQTFLDGLMSGTKSITDQRHILTAIKVKPELLILSTIYKVAFSSAFRLCIALGAGIALLGPSLWGVVAFCLGFAYIAILGLGMGFLIAPFATVNGDVRHVTNIVTRPLMFLSSVIFPLPGGEVFSVLRNINPMAVSIENIRQLLATGSPIDSYATLGMMVVLALTLFAVGWYAVHVTLPIVGDQK